ncbi:MAG: amino acid adenylation domain-containing protein, partial [Acidobacteriota bacterium]|nr:amino acid adenylation domain-containing protein [Acidobacteriota bacterium]
AASIQATRVCEYMRVALEGLVEALETEPGRAVRSIEVLPELERQQVLYEWNQTAVEYPLDKCVHELFEEQAAQTPAAVAVVYGEASLSYGELNRRANQLARYLCESRTGVEGNVGVCMDGIETIVALLGVLKAGAAYVPLDPTYPEELLGFMLRDARIQIILTVQQLSPSLPKDICRIISLDSDWTEISEDEEVALKKPTAESCAYIIYTSGSTGVRKGVVVPHRGVCNVIRWMAAEFEVVHSDIVVQKSSFCFDNSVWETFLPLCTGAKLVMAPPQAYLDTADIVQLITEHNVTITHFVPTMLGIFLEQDRLAEVTTLRQVLCGCEAVPSNLLNQFFEKLHSRQGRNVKLSNFYGPTETSIGSTIWACHPIPSGNVPIGHPVWNTSVYVLNREMQPVPVGVTGELYISGTGLAHGYLKQPGLTAERFVADPYGTPGTRMYRSGDLAQWRADGNLEFLGRADYQIKIRGFRIELGEIEARIAEYEGVREALVVAQEDTTGDKRLVVYFTCTEESETSEGAEHLRAYLLTKLPEYMVPAAYVQLTSFPLMPNGKKDRKALPTPQRSANNSRWIRTPEEEILSSLFAEVLGLERVGLDDNFFDLGGHSLLAARLVTRVRAALGIDLSLRTLLETPTVAALVTRKSLTIHSDPFEVMLPLRDHGKLPPLFFIHPAAGLSWCYTGFLKYLEADRPLYGLQAQNFTSPENATQTIEEIAAEYIVQIRKIQPEGPYRLLGWSLGGLLAHAVATSLQDQGDLITFLALLDAGPSSQKEAPELPSLVEFVADLFGDNVKSVPPDLTSLYEYLRISGNLPNSFSERHFAALIESYRNAVPLNHTFEPRVYWGDLLIVSSGAGQNDPEIASKAWEPYVSGTITVHQVSCQHGEMMNPGPLTEIGPLIAKELKKSDF